MGDKIIRVRYLMTVQQEETVWAKDIPTAVRDVKRHLPKNARIKIVKATYV